MFYFFNGQITPDQMTSASYFYNGQIWPIFAGVSTDMAEGPLYTVVTILSTSTQAILLKPSTEIELK